MKQRGNIILAIITVLVIAWAFGPSLISPAAKSNPGLSGTWTVHRGIMTELLTLSDASGALTGEMKVPNGVKSMPVKGVRAGKSLQWFFNIGDIDYSFDGTVEGNSMNGTFTVLDPSYPGGHETNLWVARR